MIFLTLIGYFVLVAFGLFAWQAYIEPMVRREARLATGETFEAFENPDGSFGRMGTPSPRMLPKMGDA